MQQKALRRRATARSMTRPVATRLRLRPNAAGPVRTMNASVARRRGMYHARDCRCGKDHSRYRRQGNRREANKKADTQAKAHPTRKVGFGDLELEDDDDCVVDDGATRGVYHLRVGI